MLILFIYTFCWGKIDGKSQLVFTPSGNFLFHFGANVLRRYMALFIRNLLTLLHIIINALV